MGCLGDPYRDYMRVPVYRQGGTVGLPGGKVKLEIGMRKTGNFSLGTVLIGTGLFFTRWVGSRGGYATPLAFLYISAHYTLPRILSS